MAIKREDVERRRVDFSDVRSGRRLPPVHPGEILRDEFLTPMAISVYELANAIKVPRSRVNDIVLGRPRRRVSVPCAGRTTSPAIAISARSNCSCVHSGASSGSTQTRLEARFFAGIAFPHRDHVQTRSFSDSSAKFLILTA
jgi:addiction module HigA family antidote